MLRCGQAGAGAQPIASVTLISQVSALTGGGGAAQYLHPSIVRGVQPLCHRRTDQCLWPIPHASWQTDRPSPSGADRCALALLATTTTLPLPSKSTALRGSTATCILSANSTTPLPSMTGYEGRVKSIACERPRGSNPVQASRSLVRHWSSEGAREVRNFRTSSDTRELIAHRHWTLGAPRSCEGRVGEVAPLYSVCSSCPLSREIAQLLDRPRIMVLIVVRRMVSQGDS